MFLASLPPGVISTSRLGPTVGGNKVLDARLAAPAGRRGGAAEPGRLGRVGPDREANPGLRAAVRRACQRLTGFRRPAGVSLLGRGLMTARAARHTSRR